MKHPLQKIIKSKNGVHRFTENKIVSYLLKRASDLNELSVMTQRGDFDREDYEQLMGLIGYSIGGYCELSLVSETAKNMAELTDDGMVGDSVESVIVEYEERIENDYVSKDDLKEFINKN